MVAHQPEFSETICLIIRIMHLKIRKRVKYFLMIHGRVPFLQTELVTRVLLILIYNRTTLPPKNINVIPTGKEKICGQRLIKKEIFILFLTKLTASITCTR